MTRYVATVDVALEAECLHHAAMDLDDALERARESCVDEVTVRELQQRRRRRLEMGDGKIRFQVRDPNGELRPVRPGEDG